MQQTELYTLVNLYVVVLSPSDHIRLLFMQLLEFDQAEFFLDLPEVVSMDSTGFVYVPSACQDQHTGIHIRC